MWTRLADIFEPEQAALAKNVLRAAASEKDAVRDALLALDEAGQALFEPLLLALKALDDKSVLYRIASEKRDLILDVMKRISGNAT